MNLVLSALVKNLRQYIKSLELCFSKRYKDQPMIFVIIAEPSAIRVNSLYFFTPYISSYSVFLIFVTKIIYYCSKDNILLHGEIQILVLSHRKQIAKYWICVWHFLKDYPNVYIQRWSFLFGVSEFFGVRYSTLTAISFWMIWSPDIFLFHYLLILGFLFLFFVLSVAAFVALSNLPTRIAGK